MSQVQLQIVRTSEILSFYGLTEQPFSLSPSPRFFWTSVQHRACLQKTRYMMDNRQGLATIIADVGMGKTTLLRYLYELLTADEHNITALLVNPQFPSALQFLKAVCGEFDLPTKRSKLEQMNTLNEFLVESYKAGKNVILLVDEAQLLVGPQLELVRQFLNFETGRDKLVQIVLTGQLELKTKLKLKRAVLSRVAISSTIDALTLDDLSEMIEFRLMVAGRRDPLFTPQAKACIYEIAHGVPREAVKLCHIALTIGAMSRAEVIEPDLIQEAAEHILEVNS